MTPNSDDDGAAWRNRYYAELAASSERYRATAFEYEKLAVEYSANIFKTLTYLAGGALIALPAAVALFGVKAEQQKYWLVASAGCFVLTLLLVCLAQAFAFFTMARRSEAEKLQENNHIVSTVAQYFPERMSAADCADEVKKNDTEAGNKVNASNKYRGCGILVFWTANVAFIFGCLFGARAILG